MYRSHLKTIKYKRKNGNGNFEGLYSAIYGIIIHQVITKDVYQFLELHVENSPTLSSVHQGSNKTVHTRTVYMFYQSHTMDLSIYNNLEDTGTDSLSARIQAE